MTRIAALIPNHRTHAKAIPSGLVQALLDLDPDVLALTEFVRRLLPARASLCASAPCWCLFLAGLRGRSAAHHTSRVVSTRSPHAG